MNNEPTITSPEKEAELKHFEAFTQSLINDESLRELPDVQRASVIADRFIGSVVRRGELQGSALSYSPGDVLKGVDLVSHTGAFALKEITNTDGLRKAVLALSLDSDVAPLIGQMSNRLSQDAEGQYTLTSAAQIEGYLLSGGKENKITNPVGGVDMEGDSWIPVIIEHTQLMAENPGLPWTTAAQARELMNSSGPLLKNSGQDWLKAQSSATKAGVDVDLLRRSAEKVQRRTKDGHDMGHTALYLATGGRVSEYKKDLDRRSGYQS